MCSFRSVMGFETLAQLGVMFSMVKIAELSNDTRLRKLVDLATKEPTSFRQLEARATQNHQVAGIKHTQLMLFHQTDLMLAHLNQWIALEKNKGGRAGNVERDYVIGRLAEACVDITGKRPSQSKNGALVQLSAEVLEDLLGTSKGIEKAVERVMASRRRRSAR